MVENNMGNYRVKPHITGVTTLLIMCFLGSAKLPLPQAFPNAAFVDVEPSRITSLMAAIDSPSKDTQEEVEEKRPRPQLSWWIRLDRFRKKNYL